MPVTRSFKHLVTVDYLHKFMKVQVLNPSSLEPSPKGYRFATEGSPLGHKLKA
ncbi:hypothetical protein H1P_50037 [Hyella patelloides LEGE 07179]|uniref:Uncharacterized protein n=1 Tax=Hyella patelloides LEGE 07179 TaxID=945734 RepID=A0A563VZE1_9CYAN|nr:hypothetical protein H1P_50037 [Hyella patelloides LEGE 07179]